MNQPTMFSSGLELANLVVSSDLLHHSWAAIKESYRENPPNVPNLHLSIKYKVFEETAIGTVIAFVSSPPCTPQYLQGEEGRGLVSSAALGENFPLFQFVSTKVNPSFSLHRAAVTLFAPLKDELSPLKNQYGNIRPLIVTGHSIGGSIASLFTLWLLETISPTDTKRPLCITFGSPLIGDNGLQQAILERPTWNSCFLHVASSQDPIPKLFVSPQNVASHANVYKPFGTFLVCSELGFACFEDPDSGLDLMVEISSDTVGNQGPNEGAQTVCYGEVLEKLKLRSICRGVSDLGGRDSSPLATGIFLQIEAMKIERTQRRQENGDISSLVAKIEKRTKDLVSRKRNVFDPSKKLNEMKINMTYLEWYKKGSASRGGYYDVFKHEQSMRREQIVKRKNILTQYWVKMVKEAEKMPQKEGSFFLIKWLYGGTNYRRMVEPLDIAEWYKKGKKDYIARRSEHYKLLEKWVEDEKSKGNPSSPNGRNRACSLTEDSCFWAHVEEAIGSCKSLENGETSQEERDRLRENLVEFEDYVMELKTNCAASPEIFLQQSSFMKWWEKYEKIKGDSYRSLLTDFMRNRGYQQYA